MFAKVLIIVGVTIVAVPAAAQQNTQCTTTFGITKCTTTGSPTSGGINWGVLQPVDVGKKYQDGYEQGQQIRARADEQRLIAEQRQALQQQQIAQARSSQYEEEQRALGRRAGALIAGGDCPGALNLALAAGNIDLANKVKGYCAN